MKHEHYGNFIVANKVIGEHQLICIYTGGGPHAPMCATMLDMARRTVDVR